jgi:hypothetical protein
VFTLKWDISNLLLAAVRTALWQWFKLSTTSGGKAIAGLVASFSRHYYLQPEQSIC